MKSLSINLILSLNDRIFGDWDLVCDCFPNQFGSDNHTGEFLNDEIINFYFELLSQRNSSCLFFSSHFYSHLTKNGIFNYKNVERWTKDVWNSKLLFLNLQKDIFQFSKIFIPVHCPPVHWCLAVINISKKKFEYYDSLGNPDSSFSVNLVWNFDILTFEILNFENFN